ncbi:MAG TPA: XRE family transcriptional regulator [Acidobacterium sp.]|nr:XRE family transcriptional regulator [Acidobacterium sp.]
MGVQQKPADIEVDQPDFGIRIKSLRRDNDLSQQELAELIGRSVDLVNLIERGKSFVSRPTLQRLKDVFGITEMSLFDFSGNKAFIESGGLKWRASRKHSPLIVRHKKVQVRVTRKTAK